MNRRAGFALVVALLGGCTHDDDFSAVDPPDEVLLDGGDWQLGIYKESGSSCWRIVADGQGSPCTSTSYAPYTSTATTWDGPGGIYAVFIYGDLDASGRLFTEVSDAPLLLGERGGLTFGAAVVPDGEVWGLQILDAKGDLVTAVSFVE